MTDTLPLADFLRYVEQGEIPPLPPELANRGGRAGLFNIDSAHIWFHGRDAMLRRGMFAIVDAVWTGALADWIGPRKVLEVMAGAGWLAKALRQHGIDVAATDDGSWHNPDPDKDHYKIDLTPVTPIERLDARDAVRKYAERDVLVVSWPPYHDETIVEAYDLWGIDKPIVYIGEGPEGCNAGEDFFARLRHDKSLSFPLMAWPMIHDDVWVGHWSKPNNSV